MAYMYKQAISEYSPKLTDKDKILVPVDLVCPYCKTEQHYNMNPELVANEKKFAVTLKCKECKEYSKIYNGKLWLLEEDLEHLVDSDEAEKD